MTTLVIPEEGFGGQTKAQIEAQLGITPSTPAPAVPATPAPVTPATPAAPTTGKFAGKYNTTADLEAGYKHAQAELTRVQALLKAQATAPAPAAVVEPVAPVVPAPLAIPAAVETPAPAAITFDEYQTEYASTGALSEASYGKLQAQGLNRATVDVYIAGFKAQQAAIVSQADAAFGGTEARTAAITWASQNLPAADIQAFNDAVTGTNASVRDLALRGLASRYKSEANIEPARVGGATPGHSGVTPFASMKELSMAQRDPRYKTDAAYRDEVSARATISNI